MKQFYKVKLVVNFTLAWSLILAVGDVCGAMGRGVYAYVELRGDSDHAAKVRQFVSISKSLQGYHVRLTTGRQILVPTSSYRDAVNYPDLRENRLSALKATRLRLRQFMSDYPASNRYLGGRAQNLSLKILQMEKASEVITKKKIGHLVLKNGKEYYDVVLSEKLDAGIKIIHQRGVTTIPADLLPDSVVSKLGGFDAETMKLALVKGKLIELDSAADSGDLDALWRLGTIFHDGVSVSKDAAKSFQYFKRAATREHAPSQLLIGFCYYQGNGTKRDLKQAVLWITKAARKGLIEAQTSLGIFYLRGNGVKQNPEDACEWFRKAAEAGDAEAQYFLGVCYYAGEGVTKDLTKAKKLLENSRDAGVQHAADFLSKHPF